MTQLGLRITLILYLEKQSRSDGNDIKLSGLLDDVDATTTGFKVIEVGASAGASGNLDDNVKQRNLYSSSSTTTSI